MALIEQRLAEALVAARLAESTGTLYWPISDHIAAMQDHLDREQWWRGQMARMADTVEALSKATS